MKQEHNPVHRFDSLLDTLQRRFKTYASRHKTIEWNSVKEKLISHPTILRILNSMEITGGEPDIVGTDEKSGKLIFMDCSQESPKGRRGLCYDKEALISRREFKPKHSAIGMAEDLGITILTESQYRHLQSLGEFDLKTSSWIETPPEIRRIGGALFCDRRYNHVFTYHNGAESYYASRGFRGSVLL